MYVRVCEQRCMPCARAFVVFVFVTTLGASRVFLVKACAQIAELREVQLVVCVVDMRMCVCSGDWVGCGHTAQSRFNRCMCCMLRTCAWLLVVTLSRDAIVRDCWAVHASANATRACCCQLHCPRFAPTTWVLDRCERPPLRLNQPGSYVHLCAYCAMHFAGVVKVLTWMLLAQCALLSTEFLLQGRSSHQCR